MSDHFSQKELESYLWGAATLLRGLIDANDYKQYIFPLLFFKRLSDVWDEDYRDAFEDYQDEGYATATANDRFTIPEGAHWKDAREASRDVGRALLDAYQAIEAANPQRLQGVFGNAAWTDKAQMPDEKLKNLIEHFSKHNSEPCQRARGRTRQQLRAPYQAIRRRQRPHRARVLYQPHARAPDGADARTQGGRDHLRPDLRHRRHAHLVLGRSETQWGRHPHHWPLRAGAHQYHRGHRPHDGCTGC